MSLHTRKECSFFHRIPSDSSPSFTTFVFYTIRLDKPLNESYTLKLKDMSIFSALLGNAGTVSREELEKKYGQLLIDSEEIEVGFKLIRDTFIFTNKRLIILDVQGVTGKKREYKSINYKSISRFSVETAGPFDLEAELKIWISSEAEPSIRKQFNRSVNVYDVQKVLAHHVLG